MTNRLDSLRAALLTAECDVLLLTNPVNIGYVTGFTGSTALALVSQTDAVLITDPRYTLRAAEECPAWELVVAQAGNAYPVALKSVIDAHADWARVGFEAAHVVVSRLHGWQTDMESVAFAETTDVVETLRLAKDPGEVAAIRRAIDVAESAFLSIRTAWLTAGKRERDAAAALEYAMRVGGADAPAFETIVASGENGARPHHSAGERVLQTGDLVTVDWGASVGGYCSDITRTVCVGGVFTARQAEVYAAVLGAQNAVLTGIKPGMSGKDADALARDFLTECGFGAAFSHSTGHALGREVHDGPGLSARSDSFILAPGQVFTVEPGAYLAGWGGVRIEEDVLITEDGCEVLTTLPRDWSWAAGS